MSRTEKLIKDLSEENINLSEDLDMEKARRILLLSECIAASMHAYMFKVLAGNKEDKLAKPIPPFYQ